MGLTSPPVSPQRALYTDAMGFASPGRVQNRDADVPVLLPGHVHRANRAEFAPVHTSCTPPLPPMFAVLKHIF